MNAMVTTTAALPNVMTEVKEPVSMERLEMLKTMYVNQLLRDGKIKLAVNIRNAKALIVDDDKIVLVPHSLSQRDYLRDGVPFLETMCRRTFTNPEIQILVDFIKRA